MFSSINCWTVGLVQGCVHQYRRMDGLVLASVQQDIV